MKRGRCRTTGRRPDLQRNGGLNNGNRRREASRPGRLGAGSTLVVAVMLFAALIVPATSQGRDASGPYDLSLSKAIELGLDHDYGVKAALSDSGAAHLEYGAARALRFPALSLEASSSRKDEIPTLDLEALGISKQIGAEEVHQADITLSLPLFTGGRISNSIRARRETSLAETARLSARRMQTAYECRRSYFELMLAEALLRSAESSLDRLKVIEQDVAYLYGSGLADSIDIFDAAIAVENGRREVSERQAYRAIAETNLKTLTGLDLSASINPSDSVTAPAGPFAPTEMAPTGSKRPEIDQLAHVAAAAERAASAARGDNFPALAAFAGYSVGKPNLDQFKNDWNDYWMAGLSLTWDFNLAGGTLKTAAAARRKARSAMRMQEDLVESLTRQGSIASEAARKAYATMKHAERQLDLAGRRFALAGERQRVGLLSANRLVEMENDLKSLEEQYRAAIVDYYLADTDYLYAIGSTRIFGGLQ